MALEIDVVDNAELRRYEARAGSEVVGQIAYTVDSEVVTLIHTEVDPAHEGKGIASRLVGGALDDIRSRGLRVRLVCSYARSYVERHPGYADLAEPG
jgi:predicted GNAT family acetyltransferase